MPSVNIDTFLINKINPFEIHTYGRPGDRPRFERRLLTDKEVMDRLLNMSKHKKEMFNIPVWGEPFKISRVSLPGSLPGILRIDYYLPQDGY